MDENGRWARFGDSKKYRYALGREIAGFYKHKCTIAFVGLNPSTADEKKNDPTVRRCIGYAKEWNYQKLIILNIFAFRSTSPTMLYKCSDPIGPYNNISIMGYCREADRIILCWGNHGLHRYRGDQVLTMLQMDPQTQDKLYALGFTGKKQPRLPYKFPNDLNPIRIVS